MRTTIRHLASAFMTGAALALIIDAALQFLTTGIRIVAPMGPSLWVRIVERSVFVALGLVLWLTSPLLGEWIDELIPHAHVPRRAVWELTGIGFLTVPAGHVLGQWMVLAMQLTVAGTWQAEGGIFLSAAYYGAVLLSITPWMAAGAIVRGWAHHMVTD